MKFTLVFMLAATFNLLIHSQTNLNSSNLPDIDLNLVKTSGIVPPCAKMGKADPAYYVGKITKPLLLAQTAKKLIYTFANTQEEVNEFLNVWNPILKKSGLKPTSSEYKNTLFIQNYENARNLVLRDFDIHKLHYDALSSTTMAKIEKDIVSGLKAEKMKTVAVFYIEHEYFRPSFRLYYLTKHNENPDHEIRLRQLMTGEDIDYDVMEKAGISIVKKDTSFSMLYIGKEIGFKSKIATDRESALKKLADYKDFLRENDKEFIDFRLHILSEPFAIGENVYHYLLNIYFYQ